MQRPTSRCNSVKTTWSVEMQSKSRRSFSRSLKPGRTVLSVWSTSMTHIVAPRAYFLKRVAGFAGDVVDPSEVVRDGCNRSGDADAVNAL
mgnify:CR=1 FL=1